MSKSVKALQKEFELVQFLEKEKIKAEPKKGKRFFKWLWFLITFPFKWIFVNIRDWRTAVIFVIVFLAVSIEVWLPYLIGFITFGTDFSAWCFGIGSACWLFWLGPGTPFLVICIALTIGIKALLDKITQKAR